MKKKVFYYFLKKYMSMFRYHFQSKRNMMSAFDLRIASENVCAEILNNLNSTTNMLKEAITQNFIPMKFK
jgi:hypothetical protein